MSTGINEFSVGQWRERNLRRRYPFTDASSLEVLDNTPLPLSTFVDARIYLADMQGTLELIGFEVTGNRVNLRIENSLGSLSAVATIDRDNPRSAIEVSDRNGNPAGVLVSGENNWAEFSNYGRGEFTFSPGTASFALATYTYAAPTSHKVLQPDGSPVTGTIRLVGERGVRLSCEQRGGKLVVVVNVVGDPLYKAEDCELDLQQSSQLIERVVFQSGSRLVTCYPDEHGRMFVLSATHAKEDAALRVKGTESGLQFGIAGRSL